MSSSSSPVGFEELEHNPFAESGSVSSTNTKVQDPLTAGNSHAVDERTVAHPDSASAINSLDTNMSTLNVKEGKERTSSLLVSKFPIDVDIPRQANEDLHIAVHDPQTIGEGLKAHTIYSVSTKTSSPLFRTSQMTVQRRFREFLSLNQQLSDHNPGVIVPPAPDKHAIGRFEEDFVENRRIMLQRMMLKISKHPILNKDPSFVKFLETESLNTDLDASTANLDGANRRNNAASNFLGMFGDLNAPKIQETDDYMEGKRQSIDAFDSQLRQVSRSVDSIIKQRDSLSDAVSDFADVCLNLSQSEINKASEKNLVAFAQVQRQLKDLYSKQAEYDLFYLANSIDEYLRIVNAAKNAFGSRVKAYQTWQTNEQSLIKTRIALEKSRLSAKGKQEKMTQIESEILDWESKVVSSKKEFEDVTKLLKSELEAFEGEKVHDIIDSMRGQLKSTVLIQQQIIKVWEQYLRTIESVAV